MNADEDTQSHDEPGLLASYILFLVAALVLVLGFAAPTFRVSRVIVKGQNVPVVAVAAASGAQGHNIFTIRGASIVHNLENVPDIIVTSVSISLPNTVVVRATERRPVFAWKQRGSLFEVDHYGRLISRVGSTQLPVVVNNTAHTYGLRDVIGPAVTLGVTYATRTLRHAQIRSFVVGAKRGLYIYSNQGWEANLGLPTPSELVVRIATLQSFIDKNSDGRLRRVDLRSQFPYAHYAP